MGHYRRHIRLFQYAGPAFLFLSICLGTGLRDVCADEVVLTNGDRISGRLLSLSQGKVRISTSHSGILETNCEYIQSLNTDNPMVVELVSGERVIGRIESGGEKTIIVHSFTLGDRVLSLMTVASVCLLDKNIHKKTAENDAQVIGTVDGSNPSRFNNEKNIVSARLQDFRGKGSGAPAAPERITQKAQETSSTPKPIGSKPEDEEDIRKIFLRQTTVLLKPGVKELEVGLDYLSNQVSATVYNARFRQLQVPLGFRIGIIEGLEGSVSIPFTYAKQEFSFADDSVIQDTTGIGDTVLGLNYEILRETARWPDITTLLRIRAPTGAMPSEEGLSTGSGHWAGSFGFQFMKTTDPIVLFWGIRYTHDFPATYFFNDGIYEVQPGDTIDYNFGFGFAVNDNVSLSAQVLGGYQWETELDGQRLSGSSGEPVSLRSALTYRLSRQTYIEPSLRMGLNNEAPDFVIDLTATYRFGK